MKTVRFSQIVETCGRPDVHLSWVTPKNDHVLMSALKQNRVMTVHRVIRGTTKDYGTVGLMLTPNAQLFIFPRSLKRFGDRRVVGIDYSLLAAPAAGTARESDTPQRSKSRTKANSHTSLRPPNDSHPDRSEQKEGLEQAHEPLERPGPKQRPDQEMTTQEPSLTWDDVRREITKARAALRRRQIRTASEKLERLAERIRNIPGS